MTPTPPLLLLADQWRDYQLLETGGGMKMERWGDVVLVRPDPQVIWPRRGGTAWTGWDGFYHRAESGGGRWEFRRTLPESWTIRYGALTFRIRPTDFKHTGLFPEQAVNWDWCAEKIRAARTAGREISVLNLFGYSGGATVACAAAGANVCHVDASKGMIQWCRENAALSIPRPSATGTRCPLFSKAIRKRLSHRPTKRTPPGARRSAGSSVFSPHVGSHRQTHGSPAPASPTRRRVRRRFLRGRTSCRAN